MEVSVHLCVSLEIARRDKAGLREAEMLMWTKVWSTVCICVTVCVCAGFVSPFAGSVCLAVCWNALFLVSRRVSFLPRPLWEYMCVLHCMSVCIDVCVVCGHAHPLLFPHHVCRNVCMSCNGEAH